jgi:hypothetical protein
VREAEPYGNDRPACRTGSRAARATGEAGLSLLELIVALSVFALVVLAVSASIDSGLTLTRNNRERSVAANLASQEMDTVRSSLFTSLVARTVTQVVDGSTYTTIRELTWVPKGATNGPCDGSNASPALMRVHVSVSWPNMRGVKPVVADTLLAPPVGAYSATSGHIAVKVLDSTAAGEFGTSVLISGPVVQTLPTNSQGCAFFAFLPAGTYAVSLNTPGFVDRQSVAVPTQTAGVTVGNTSSVQFEYAQAASLTLTFTADAGGSIPNNLPITLGNTQFVPTGTKRFFGTGMTRTLGSLFPAAGGYTAWAGSCADADPEGQNANTGGPYWPGAQRPDALDSQPGSSITSTVAVKSAGITVYKPGSLPLAGVTVVATHTADQLCGSGATYTLGTTDAAGFINAALPFGTWRISVTGKSPVGGTWPNLVLDPNATTTPTLSVNTL